MLRTSVNWILTGWNTFGRCSGSISFVLDDLVERLDEWWRASSGNNYFYDANAALLASIKETIDSTSEKGQCQRFHRTADGGRHDGLVGDSMIESLNGVDQTSPCVLLAPN